MLSKEVSRTILKVFGMTRPGIEPFFDYFPSFFWQARYPGYMIKFIVCKYLFVKEEDFYDSFAYTIRVHIPNDVGP